jgi:hypothetical protein
MLGYLVAAVAAVYLIVATFVQDRKDKERAKMKEK